MENLPNVQDQPIVPHITLNLRGNIVVTWGFMPSDVWHLNTISEFCKQGFRMFWFDGDRSVALRNFSKKGLSEEMFHEQIRNINNSGIVNRLTPIPIDPFDASGIRPFEDIVQTLFAFLE